MSTEVIENVPKTMHAMVLTGHGGMDRYKYYSDGPVPHMGPKQVLSKVHACGINNTDVNTRSGLYSKAVSEATTGDSCNNVDEDDPIWSGAPLTFPRIQGADICGTVVNVGAEADATLLGKRVMADALLRDWSDPQGMNAVGYLGSECDGGFADYVVIDRRNIMAIAARSGVSGVNISKVHAAYSLGANKRQIMRYVIIPNSLPEIFTGARVAMGVCWGTVVAAELVAAEQGAGMMIMTASKFQNTDIVIMGIILIGVIGFGIDMLMRWAERILVPWKGKG